jgi:hypothetical protein
MQKSAIFPAPLQKYAFDKKIFVPLKNLRKKQDLIRNKYPEKQKKLRQFLPDKIEEQSCIFEKGGNRRGKPLNTILKHQNLF